MIPSCPPDFWDTVARRVAAAILDRESTLGVRVEGHPPYAQSAANTASQVSQLRTPKPDDAR